MTSVRELLDRPLEMRPVDVQVAEGCLVVTRQLTVLFPSEDDRQTGIIVPTPGLIEEWIKDVPPLGGSRVFFLGQASVRAKFGASGIHPLPLLAIELERIEYRDRHGFEAVYEPNRGK